MIEPIVRIVNLSHAYEEGLPAINDVSLEIPNNAFLGIIGHNGAGKTTLVKHLNGLLKPTRGKVIVSGIDTTSTSTAVLARTVGFVFQNPDHQIFSSTVREEIAFGLRNLGVEPRQMQERVEQSLGEFGLLPFAETPPAMLGYGLRRKVSLAAVLVMEPKLLVLDEPTVGLDASSADEFFHFITQLHHKGHTIVLVTHDMRLVTRYCTQCIVMSQGQALADRAPREIFADLELLARAGLTQPAVTALGRSLRDAGMPTDLVSVSEFMRAYASLVAKA